jgi:2-polyprenyl-6-methoxyphenol hydroxylase-like FAD-dependent oxidoreductase
VNKVVIIGGGIGGLTLALALKQRGIAVTVHEKYDHQQHHQTGFLIWSYAIALLQKLDVPVHLVGTPLEVFEVHGRSGQKISEMPIGKISRSHGADSFEINRRRLIECMSDMVGDDLEFGHKCVSVENSKDSAVAFFEDGSSDEGDVVVGCDGAHSVVRAAIHPDAELKMLDAGGWIAVMDQHPPSLQKNRHMDFWQPGCKAGVADIGNGEARWYVGFNHRLPDDSVSKMEQIKKGMVHIPEVIQQCMEMTTELQMVSTKAGDLLALDPWYQGRLLLMGDAAHATSPYAGMGACAAIADAFALAEMLDQQTDVEMLLTEFQKQRKPVADAVIKESRHGLDMSTSRSRFRNWIRDWGLSHIPEHKMKEIVDEMVTGG